MEINGDLKPISFAFYLLLISMITLILKAKNRPFFIQNIHLRKEFLLPCASINILNVPKSLN